MASEGPNYPDTATTSNASGGTIDWSNPSNIVSNDGNYATATNNPLGAVETYYLKATDFDFTIPSGATIDGITVTIDRKSSLSLAAKYVVDAEVKIIKGGAVGSTNKADTSTKWPTSDGTANYGGASDLWGETWADTDINSANFGVAISASINSLGDDVTASIDYISITVNYTAASTPSASVSPSMSPSPSASQSPSASVSPSISLSPSASQSPSASVSPSVSKSPSASPSPTPSASPSPSPSASQSPSASVSPSVSKSPSASPSPTPSASQSPSVSKSPSASVSKSPSASQSPSSSISPSASVSPSPSASPSPIASERFNIAPIYYIVVRDYDNKIVAIFDTWKSADYVNKVNDVGSYSVTIVDDGTRDLLEIFQLDYRVEFVGKIAGLTGWEVEFRGFHRNTTYSISEDGVMEFTSDGVGLDDLLMRSIVAYKGGTVRADKDCASETAIKEYVEENCGPTADNTVVGRLYQGGLPNFLVDLDTGAGKTWTGSKPGENVLDVVKEISEFSAIDFAVDFDTGNNTFIFKTFPEQRGDDRTTRDLDPTTGRNGVGLPPVIFTPNIGNTKNFTYKKETINETNVVVVYGRGDGSTRYTITVQDDDAIAKSPWNRREASRSGGSYDTDAETNSMTTEGNKTIEENKPKESFEFSPMQVASCLYMYHYYLGDRVTIRWWGEEYHKKIMEISVSLDESGERTVDVTYADIPSV